jgi:lysophospholipase L1-like esterase
MNVAKWLAIFGLGLAAGCGGGDDGMATPEDFGGNNPDVIVALGDSITAGVDGGGTPWPARLATLSGKTVVNAGVGGEESGGGANRIGSLLRARKPGYILIFYGANDAIMQHDIDRTLNNIRGMVAAAKANKTAPVLATLLPMVGEHVIYNSAAVRISTGIRQIGGEEGVPVVDLAGEFGDPQNQLLPDGLHPNDLGNQIIALAFADALPH